MDARAARPADLSRRLEPSFLQPSVIEHSLPGCPSVGKPLERCVSGLLRGWDDRRVDCDAGPDQRVARDFANVSVNDDFRFVVRLLALIGLRWLIGFWCPCHALLQLIKRPFVDRSAENARAND